MCHQKSHDHLKDVDTRKELQQIWIAWIFAELSPIQMNIEEVSYKVAMMIFIFILFWFFYPSVKQKLYWYSDLHFLIYIYILLLMKYLLILGVGFENGDVIVCWSLLESNKLYWASNDFEYEWMHFLIVIFVM